MDQLALTDDEAVAVALALEQPWRSLLPTLDTASTDDAIVAGRRGVRSLTVRGLLDAPGGDGRISLTSELENLVRPLLVAAPRRSCVVVDEDNRVVVDGLMIYDYANGREGSILEVISTAGVHYLSATSRATADELIGGVIRDTFESGLRAPEGLNTEETMRLWVAGPGIGSDASMIVEEGSIQIARHDGDGILADEPEHLATVHEAIVRLG